MSHRFCEECGAHLETAQEKALGTCSDCQEEEERIQDPERKRSHRVAMVIVALIASVIAAFCWVSRSAHCKGDQQCERGIPHEAQGR